MKYNHIRLFFVCAILFITGNLFSQTKSYILNDDKTEVKLLIDKKKTKYSVSELEDWKKGRPLPEAKLYELNINADSVGTWILSDENENTWMLSIKVPEAKGFFVSFEDFQLPVGAKLYAYNQNLPQKAIVFTHHDNPKGGIYSLEGLKGDNVVLEYVSHLKEELPKLHIKEIGYKYTDNQDKELSGFETKANSCMTNINCPEADFWEAQKKGIVQLRMRKSNGRTFLCSGSLVNNTANDKTPYLLTAEHCFEDMTKEQITETEFFFEYESPTCETTTLPIYKYHKGSELLVLNPLKDGSDGALLKLSDNIPEDWDVYFNGWDRENVGKNIQTGSIIHHPLGDVKKITFYDKPLVASPWYNNTTKKTHWLVYYSKGATEGGSSGSPIFNQNGLIVGTLSGGDGNCTTPYLPDYYGKFWYHWDQYQDADAHMSKYLDPKGTNPERIGGLYNNENATKDIILERYKVDMTVDDQSSIKILAGNGGYSVTSTDENVISVTLENNVISITAHKLGKATIQVVDRKGNKKEVNISVNEPVDFIFVDVNDKILSINVYKEDDTLKEVRLVDLDGDVFLAENDLKEKSHILNLNILRRGVYILQIKTHKGIKRTEKIIW